MLITLFSDSDVSQPSVNSPKKRSDFLSFISSLFYLSESQLHLYGITKFSDYSDFILLS